MSHQLLIPRRGMNTPTVNGRQVADHLSQTGVYNLGITYATGTFSITAADGSALSSTNPAWVCINSKANPAQLIWVSVTANQTFIDDNGASTIIGNLFGLTTAVSTGATTIPFFLYAVLNDAENAISFMISRFPNTFTSPVTAKIGKTGSAVADTQGSFFALGNPTVTDYDENPCLCIGSFKMTMSASDDWTVSAFTNSDGIGKFQEGFSFSVPKGQFGAAATKWFLNNGGTAPDQTAGIFTYNYLVDQKANVISFLLNLENVNVAGVGAVTATLSLPYVVTTSSILGNGEFNTGTYTIVSIFGAASTQTCIFGFVNPTNSNVLQNASFASGAVFRIQGYYSPVFS